MTTPEPESPLDVTAPAKCHLCDEPAEEGTTLCAEHATAATSEPTPEEKPVPEEPVEAHAELNKMYNDAVDRGAPEEEASSDKPRMPTLEEIPMAQAWHITPIRLPQEVREAIEETIRDQGLSIVEYLVHWAMFGAGYDEKEIEAVRRLCYPKESLEPITRQEE